MPSIVVFGATGYTGRLVVSALATLGLRDVVLGGRDPEKLRRLADLHGGLETRVADARRPETLPALVRGAHVVIDTAGPFVQLGEPVVRAALEAGAHFLDTTGEQAYMIRVLRDYDALARERRRVVINGQAFEFALGICAGALLAESDPTLDTVDVINRVSDPLVSRGTVRSAFGIFLDEVIELHDGALRPRGPSPRPLVARFPGERRSEFAIPFPGAEALHLGRAFPALRRVTTNLALPRPIALAAMGLVAAQPWLAPLSRRGALAPAERLIDRLPEGPSDLRRQAQRFDVFARGRRRGVLVHGHDAYGITGLIAALGAKLLCEGDPRAVGVVGAHEAFGAKAFLDALAPHEVGHSFHDLAD